MPRTLRYQCGVTRIIPGVGEITLKHDEAVKELQAQWRSRVDINTPEFRDRIIRNALRLFSASDPSSGFANWLVDQHSNITIHGHNYEFLMDCVNYINTGHRPYSHATRGSLMDFNPVRCIPHRANDHRLAKFIEQLGIEAPAQGMSIGDYCLVKWCSHHGGVFDLLESLILIFGETSLGETNTYVR